MKGNMELPTIQQGKRRLVKINEGQVFLLPSRIPHSPQRQAGTFGLVVERKRHEDEVDGLRWYTSFEQPDTSTDGSKPNGVLWDRFFYCGDLEKDLVPVVKAYKGSPECSDVRSATIRALLDEPSQAKVSIGSMPTHAWRAWCTAGCPPKQRHACG